jgi:hypothetical protein
LGAIATVSPSWLIDPVWLISMILRLVLRIAFAGCFRERLNWSISMFSWRFVK